MKKTKINSLFVVGIVLLVMISMIGALYMQGVKSEADSTDAIKSANEQKVYNFLLLGRDNSAGLCDVIILVSINTQSGDVNLMQIPRDTYFNYTDGSYKKINGAVNALGSPSSFANALADAMSINIDYYLSVDLDAVSQMIDTMSGVEINVPMDMDYDDPEQGLSIHLKAGQQMLDGKNAVSFLRYRSGYVTGDLGRIDAQKLFLNAFAKRLGEQKNPLIYLSLLNIVSAKGETNIKEQDIISVGMKCSRSKDGEIYYMTAPGEAVQSEKSGAWYYILSRSANAEMLDARFGLTVDQKDFDKDNKFVDKRVKSFYDIYNRHGEYKIYTADEVENNQVNIN